MTSKRGTKSSDKDSTKAANKTKKPKPSTDKDVFNHLPEDTKPVKSISKVESLKEDPVDKFEEIPKPQEGDSPEETNSNEPEGFKDEDLIDLAISIVKGGMEDCRKSKRDGLDCSTMLSYTDLDFVLKVITSTKARALQVKNLAQYITSQNNNLKQKVIELLEIINNGPK